MPINVPKELPAVEILQQENIFAFSHQRATQQDIRPLKVVIANLMPQKINTETQLLRLLSQSPLQIEVTFLKMTHHDSKNTSAVHLAKFYQTFSQIQKKNFDGLIITGAPIEKIAFEAVDYWRELTTIMDWSQKHCTSCLHICWGAQAGLYHHYGIDKVRYDKKLFGVFEQRVTKKDSLVQSFDDRFVMPHSRYTGLDLIQLAKQPELREIVTGTATGPSILVSRQRKNIFILGHFEYQTETLKEEYERDRQKGLTTALPENYFAETGEIANRWRAHAALFFSNWLNEVYQVTPYEW